MAIAGTGGWVPSCRVVLRFDKLSEREMPVATGIVQNKPAALIYSDDHRGAYGTLADGLVRMRRGEAVQIDMTNGQFLRLLELWRVQSNATSGRGRDGGLSGGAAAAGAGADDADGGALADGGELVGGVDRAGGD